MIVPRLIARKRDGGALTAEEWTALVAGFTSGEVPEYQMSALLMASLLRGLNADELDAVTEAMLGSGARLDPPRGRPIVDKHSTGGVGDKVSLVLAPLVAACGVAVPMMSGRGLGHTGGTLDKLESIPGFRTDLPLADARRQLADVGCVMMGQTPEIVPADRKMYALRDVTATVESIPLIAASIMSKKLAEGLDGLVLDVKRGSGAFLPPVEQGLELARTMIALGEARGCRTVALVTAMDRPLGRACGNALETREALEALRGRGPDDLMEVTYALGAEMLFLAGVAGDGDAARSMLVDAIRTGRAAETFRDVIEAQGGDARVCDDPSRLPAAGTVAVFEARAAGYVAGIEPREVGTAILAMGGGRRTMTDTLDLAAGFVFDVEVGERVAAGQPLASVHAGNEEAASIGLEALERAVTLSPDPAAAPLPLVSHRVTAAGAEELGGV